MMYLITVYKVWPTEIYQCTHLPGGVRVVACGRSACKIREIDETHAETMCIRVSLSISISDVLD